MNEIELRRSRAVYKELALRLRQIKARLRNVVITDGILSGNHPALMGWTNVERMRAFRYSLTSIIVQVLDNFLGNTAQPELETITSPLVMAMSVCAEHCMKKQMTPQKAWQYLSDAFDVAVKGDVATFALKVVLTKPVASLVKDAAPSRQMQMWDADWIFCP